MKMKTKKVLRVLAITAGILLALLALSPLWLGPVGRFAANIAVPGITGTEFNMAELSVNPYSGRVEVGSVDLANPEGFSEKRAVALGSLKVKMSPASLFTDTIHIESIEVNDLFVSYVSSSGKNNFDVIAANAAGPAEAEETLPDAQPAEGETPAAGEKEEVVEEEGGKKVVIDVLSLSGVKVKVGPVTIPLPPIVLRDIGKESDMTLEEVAQEVLNAVLKASASLGDALTGVLGGLGSGAQSVISGVADGIGEAAGIVDSAGSGAVKGVSDAAKGTAEAVKDAGKMLKGLFK